jgi:hypothetical protein
MSRSRSLEDLRAYRALALIGAVLLTGLSFAGILVVFQMGSSPGTWLVVGDLATLGLILVPVGAALLSRSGPCRQGILRSTRTRPRRAASRLRYTSSHG